jgi:hypothetical protein
MKNKIGAMMFLTVLLVGAIGMASAANDTAQVNATTDLNATIPVKDAGLVPGQFFYGFDKAFDNVRFALAANGEAKTKIGLKIAEERLAEAEKLAAEGKYNLSDKAIAQHDKYLTKVENRVQQINSGDNANQSEAALRAMARVQLNLEAHQEKIAQTRLQFTKLNTKFLLIYLINN